MFRNRNKNKGSSAVKKAAPTVISADLSILGNLISEGVLDIDGKIEGNVRARYVTLRQNGQIIGDLHADVAQVYGQVKGLVKARDVHLYASCSVEGTIMHEALSIEDGAFVDGKFKRTDKEQALEKLPFAGFQQDEEEEDNEPIDLMQNIRLISSNEG
jgi:cytoskeletal protein CcmA (bactofilin family)